MSGYSTFIRTAPLSRGKIELLKALIAEFIAML